MNNRLNLGSRALLLMAGFVPRMAAAQTYTENFTGTATNNSWYLRHRRLPDRGHSRRQHAGQPRLRRIALLQRHSVVPRVRRRHRHAAGYRRGRWRRPAIHGLVAQTGAILSQLLLSVDRAGAQGLQVSFTTVTYEGDSGGGGGDGADGMSFFLQDATYPADVGAFGGSLAYTCSNMNNNGTLRANGRTRGYDGLQGGFVGLGIDEYGNFLNQGDNTAPGYGYVPMRIGLRGPGSTAWSWLSANYPTDYPSTLTNAQAAAAVQKLLPHRLRLGLQQPGRPRYTTTKLADYTAIPGAYSILPATRKLANESATTAIPSGAHRLQLESHDHRASQPFV